MQRRPQLRWFGLDRQRQILEEDPSIQKKKRQPHFDQVVRLDVEKNKTKLTPLQRALVEEPEDVSTVVWMTTRGERFSSECIALAKRVAEDRLEGLY